MKHIYLISLSIFMAVLIFSCDQTNANSKKSSTTSSSSKKRTNTNTEKPKTLGQKLFLMCKACHSVRKGQAHKTGPNLYGLFGKKAASDETYPSYSEGLKNSGIVWSEEELRNWLSSPAKYIPGTSMAFVGIKEREKQDALIEYLKKITK